MTKHWAHFARQIYIYMLVVSKVHLSLWGNKLTIEQQKLFICCTVVLAGMEEDITIAVFIWCTEVNSYPKYFVALFDINQWYQAQMPNTVKWKRKDHGYVILCYIVHKWLMAVTKDNILLLETHSSFSVVDSCYFFSIK